ncbi:MAG TPA: heme ABC exporter ATP-binding protein CcmA [Vicinamibacterales bacterium]|nr:heme ABC exporter ATP-binding protein CcmA [Vicinamibacterales bacterium]
MGSVSDVTTALTARQLTRRFGNRVAVDNVSIDLRAGEIFALLGPNGAGKTTTLRMLAGLIAPTSGTVQIDDEAMTPDAAPRLRARLGFLTEAPGLWDNLTVRENLTVYARLYGLSDPGRAVDEALALFRIADRSEDRAARLSKGLKQRVALARAIVHRPRVVMLDEPTSGLDPASARDVRELIVAMRSEGRAILLCTHNLDEVDRVADRVAVLKSRLVANGTPESLRQQLFAPRLRIRLTDSAERFVEVLRAGGVRDLSVNGHWLSIASSPIATAQIVRTLVEAGAGVEAVETEEPSLEDVYIKLVAEGGSA